MPSFGMFMGTRVLVTLVTTFLLSALPPMQLKVQLSSICCHKLEPLAKYLTRVLLELNGGCTSECLRETADTCMGTLYILILISCCIMKLVKRGSLRSPYMSQAWKNPTDFWMLDTGRLCNVSLWPKLCWWRYHLHPRRYCPCHSPAWPNFMRPPSVTFGEHRPR